MSLFKSLYEKAIIVSHESAESKEVKCNIYPHISDASVNSLFFIYNYATLQIRYPYSMSASALDSFLILYTTMGQGTLNYNGQQYLLSADSIAFIDCHLGFRIELCNSSNWFYERLYLNSKNLGYFFNRFYSDNIPVLNFKELTGVKSAFNKLTDYLVHNNSNEVVCSMLIDSLLTNLLIEKQTQNKSEQPPTYIQLIRELFDHEYDQNYSLDQLAKQFKISKYTLSRNFDRFVGMSPIEYLISRRITIAKQLLLETELTINEVAAKIGISNPTHFINLFRKRVGVTPLQYRKQATNELNIINDIY